jgi:drug/metabolite transporter (DMT)-like permease
VIEKSVTLTLMASVAANPRRQVQVGSLYGLASALLFGASTPVSKLLLPEVGPLMLAALLYLGAAALIGLFRLSRFLRARPSAEARLRGSDAPVLCAMIGFGGVLGPVLMLLGPTRISALAGSLLLNLEAVFTILIAVLFFREHLGLSGATAAVIIIVGAALVGFQPGALRGDTVGVLAIVGACLSWAIDNNLSQRLSVRDPVAVAQFKTAGAGATTMMLALLTGYALPAPLFMAGSMALGGLSYGMSLICVMLAFRHLGAAREAAWFSTAPFMGAALSIAIFGVIPNAPELVGILAMVAGVLLLVRERHGHFHTHARIEHDHAHVHDEHHHHAHDGPVIEPHSHAHRHASITHDHPHVSDVHHRHRHV